MIAVIPAYEPDEKLIKVVNELHSETDYSIVVVDDGSSDSCRPVFETVESFAHVIHHEVNRGKGAAMKTAFDFIKNSGEFSAGDGIVTVDADGQHLLPDIVRVCEEWVKDPDSLVLGGRKFTGKVPLRSRFGNGVTRFVFAMSTGVRVHDTQTGLRAFSVSSIDKMLAIGGDRYEYEINQLLWCTKNHKKINEIEIETVYLNNNESSHFNTLKDSWRIYKTIFAFMGSSIISWLVDYVLLLGLNALFSALTGGAGFNIMGHVIDTKLPAIVIARAASSTVNYCLNRRVVFRSGNKHSVPMYFLTVIVMLAINYGLLYLMGKAGIKLAIAQILAQLIIYPLNFIIQRKFIFNKKQES